MTKYVKACDCPLDRDYNSFIAGKFHEVEVRDGKCVHCGYMAIDMKFTDLQNKHQDIPDKLDEIQDQTLELSQDAINSLGGNDVHFDEFSKGIY
jgi:hypothetical protein